ncbi:MAG: hypothetical protein FWE66_04740 [Oscillospiraceae bacterium]|nr:hypothetical protein [Oscillospiraceae bacterium]
MPAIKRLPVERALLVKQFFFRFIQLVGGIFLFAVGIVFVLNANIGYAPWDAFHVGISSTFGISIGTASVLTSCLILVTTALLKEKIGVGTVLNGLMVGVFMDIILYLNIIPTASGYLFGIIMQIFGLFIMALGSYLYIKTGFGAGPRDGLMVAVTKLTPLPIGVCRSAIELCAAAVGWLLGAKIGLGTLISITLVGFCVQITFKAFKFDVTQVKHETLLQTFMLLKQGYKPDAETAEQR